MRVGKMWEAFFNRQSDADWTWGPFVSLRPPPTAPIRPWVWVRLFVIFTVLGLLLVALLLLPCALLPSWAAARHRALPPPVAEAFATAKAMVADRQTQILLLGLLPALPALFFLFCLPYHWAWNRRVARLRAIIAPAPSPPDEPGLWPPPVRR